MEYIALDDYFLITIKSDQKLRFLSQQYSIDMYLFSKNSPNHFQTFLPLHRPLSKNENGMRAFDKSLPHWN